MKTSTIRPRSPIHATVTPPGSKSMTNRALILAALSDGETTLDGALDSEDTKLMLDALRQLGLQVRHDVGKKRISVIGRRGVFPNHSGDIYVGNSGTTARFLTAVLAFSDGSYRIHGKPRMHLRPIGDLLDALIELGANVRSENDDLCPPVLIRGVQATPIGHSVENDAAKTVAVAGNVSSQFLSALLMAAPLASQAGDITIAIAAAAGRLVSKPYVAMTLEMMKDFGVQADIAEDFSRFKIVRHSCYASPGLYEIEPDASAASYFFAAAAVCGGSVTVPGLSRKSLQGDVEFVTLLEKMGCFVRWNADSITVARNVDQPLRGVTVDMNACSDTAQTLAVAALFADGPTEILNIEHVRHKETDRIADLATELRRFGAMVEERQGGLRITPPETILPATVKTYDDHRMAMSFAVAGLRVPGVVIEDPDCVQKTFPTFFEELEGLGTGN